MEHTSFGNGHQVAVRGREAPQGAGVVDQRADLATIPLVFENDEKDNPKHNQTDCAAPSQLACS